MAVENEDARGAREHEAKNALLSLLDGDAMTQEEIARELNVSVRTIARWCSGHSVPSKRNLKDLLRLAAD